MNQVIVCNGMAELVEICAMLVREGVGFTATTNDGYVITLSGAF